MATKMRAEKAPWMSALQGGASEPWACRLQIPVSHTGVRSGCFVCAEADCTDFTVTTASRRSGHSPASSFAALPAYTRRCSAARSAFRCSDGSGRFIQKSMISSPPAGSRDRATKPSPHFSPLFCFRLKCGAGRIVTALAARRASTPIPPVQVLRFSSGA